METLEGRKPYHMPGTPGSPFTFIEEEGRFRGTPSYEEAWHRTKTRMAAGGKFKRHPTPPGTPIPKGKKMRTSSQPSSTTAPLEHEPVASSSSQPVVMFIFVAICMVPCGMVPCAMSDLPITAGPLYPFKLHS